VRFRLAVGHPVCGKSTCSVVADLMAPRTAASPVGGTPPRNLRHAGRIGPRVPAGHLMPWTQGSETSACCAW